MMNAIKKIRMTRRWVAAFLWCVIFSWAPNAHAASMPDVLGEWRALPERVTELKTSETETQGRWSNRVYTRGAPSASVEVNLMEGPGPGTLFVPEGKVAGDDAPLGFSSTYETLDVAGHRAILERGEVTGQALAIALGKNRTLTLESKSLSRQELIGFAEKLAVELDENGR
ncbi:MAG: hypothetical protein LBJ22_06155 [Synergistaceae bacterium]|jgi:hypothetical protein|nr:hypothetical protein [Synergistaceae bacterium]